MSVLKVIGVKMDFRTWAPFLALIALMILGTLINPIFLTADNLINVLTRSAFIGIIAVGMTFVITAGGIDLSVGSMMAFICGVTIILMNYLVGIFGISVEAILLGVLAALVLGLLAGWVNGIIATKGGIEPFIVTLGTLAIYRSLTVYLADGGTLTLNWDLRSLFRPVYYGDILGVPFPVVFLFVTACVGYVILNYTRFGRYCFAIGSNEQVAEYSAINVDRVKTLTYMLVGLCVGLAAIIFVPRLGSASSSTGVLWELQAIAAVIIGGTVLQGGHGRIWGSVVGAIILSMIGNILNLSDMISNYLNGTVQGIIIIIAVYLQRAQWKKSRD